MRRKSKRRKRLTPLQREVLDLLGGIEGEVTTKEVAGRWKLRQQLLSRPIPLLGALEESLKSEDAFKRAVEEVERKDIQRVRGVLERLWRKGLVLGRWGIVQRRPRRYGYKWRLKKLRP